MSSNLLIVNGRRLNTKVTAHIEYAAVASESANMQCEEWNRPIDGQKRVEQHNRSLVSIVGEFNG